MQRAAIYNDLQRMSTNVNDQRSTDSVTDFGRQAKIFFIRQPSFGSAGTGYGILCLKQPRD